MFKLFGKKPAKLEKAAPAEEGCGCGCGHHHDAPKAEAEEEGCCGGHHEKEGGCGCGGH